jgi:glycosyltransferase involved in cell wall biosynthesis
MKVLLLAPHPFFQNRGTPIADRALLELLSSRGDTVDLLAFPEGEDLAIPGCTIHRVARLPGIRGVRPGFSWKKLLYDAVMLPRCARMTRANRYDVIHAVEESAFLALLMKKLYGVPFVYDMDSSIAQQMVEKFGFLRPARPLFEAFERRLVRESVAVAAVCQGLERLARSYDPAKVVHPVEDFSLLPEGGTEGPADPEISALAGEGPVILYVGNLEAYQGIDLLLEAFRLAAAREATARLCIVGGHPADVARYRQRAGELGIGARARFLGPRPVDALGTILREATVLVSPRIKGQNTPMKIYSYLDSDRPVLATSLPTHTQVLDEEIALLVEPTPEAMAGGILRLIGDPELRTMLARMAKLRVRAEYSREAFHRKMGAFYEIVEREVRARGAKRTAA